MTVSVGFLGYGEAAQSFCSDGRWQATSSAYDIKLDKEELRSSKEKELAALDTKLCRSPESLAQCSNLILSLVTADQALRAAQSIAGSVMPETLYLDMNSSAPDTKRAAAKALADVGTHYVDVAVMSPVYPKQLDAPLLIAGPKAKLAQESLISLGFKNTRVVSDKVGQASVIKMIRSVMIKGIEALTAEASLAAAKAEVLDEVFGSMGDEWLGKVDYNLERMMVHGERRAAEMREVVKTVEGLGLVPLMSQGTVNRQQQIGELGYKTPPQALSEKLDLIHRQLSEVSR